MVVSMYISFEDWAHVDHSVSMMVHREQKNQDDHHDRLVLEPEKFQNSFYTTENDYEL